MFNSEDWLLNNKESIANKSAYIYPRKEQLHSNIDITSVS